MRALFDVIKRPCLTEKSNFLQDSQNKIAFEVDCQANKIEIKRAVESLFNVKVSKVSTTHMNGKQKRVGAKSFGKTKDWKKAYVTLSEGNINFIDEL